MCAYVCMYVCTYVCMCVYVHICNIYVRVYVYVYVCMCVCSFETFVVLFHTSKTAVCPQVLVKHSNSIAAIVDLIYMCARMDRETEFNGPSAGPGRLLTCLDMCHIFGGICS